MLAAYIMIVAHNNSNSRKCGKNIGRKGMVVKIGAVIVVIVLTVTIQYCNFGHCHTRPQARSFRKWEPESTTFTQSFQSGLREPQPKAIREVCLRASVLRISVLTLTFQAGFVQQSSRGPYWLLLTNGPEHLTMPDQGKNQHQDR